MIEVNVTQTALKVTFNNAAHPSRQPLRNHPVSKLGPQIDPRGLRTGRMRLPTSDGGKAHVMTRWVRRRGAIESDFHYETGVSFG